MTGVFNSCWVFGDKKTIQQVLYIRTQRHKETKILKTLCICIMLSIVGDEDTTGIVKLYDEERKSSETYDLSGRRLPAGSKPRGLIIENGKVTFKK